MRKLFSFALIGCLSITTLFPQTSGTLSFSVTLTAHQGRYGSEHVVAIWIVDSAKTFVKTNLRMANSNHTIKNHLNTWKSSSNLNVVDAVTGATLKSYTSPITITWNGMDINKSIVKDGAYTLWIEETWDDGTSATSTTSIAFKKSNDTLNLSPANTANFQSMNLQWVPTVQTSIMKNIQSDKPEIEIFPNPVNDKLHLTFKTLSNVKSILLTDIQGRIVYNETIEKSVLGYKTINVQGIKKGIYLLSMKSVEGKSIFSSKIVIKR